MSGFRVGPGLAVALLALPGWIAGAVAAELPAAIPTQPVAEAQGAPAADGAAPSTGLRFRRVYAPAAHLHAWPFQNETYLPVPGAEFEDLVRRAEEAAADAGLPAGAEIVECRYTAEFDGDAQITGTAEIDVRRRSGETRLVRLSPFNLAAFNARWKQSSEPAKLGTAAGGQAALEVDRDDALQFDFRQRVVRESADTLGLSLDFPNCPATSLSLSLPDAFEVHPGEYVIERGAVAGGMRSWTLRSAGGRMRMRIAKRREAAADVARNGVRTESAYDFTDRGVELTSQLRIDALHGPLENLTLELDPELTLVDARLPDRRLTWFAVKSDASGGPQRYVLDFERPLEGVGRTLLLKAVAPLVVGRKHRLPTLRAPELFWNHTTLTLSVPAPLEIVRIDPREAAFANPVPLAGSRPGEAIELQCFSAEAGADIVVARRNRPIDAAGVTRWTLAEDEITAEFHGEFRVDVGHRFTLEAELPARWIVDSVSASPATSLADWSIAEAAGDKENQRRRLLSLRLAQPLSPDRPLRLTIVGRLKHHNAGDRLGRDQLKFVEFQDTVDRRGLTALRAIDSLRLRPRNTDDSFSVTTADRLDPVRRELLGSFPADYLVQSSENWEFDVARRAVAFTAATSLVVVVEPTSFVEQYRFQLTNEVRLPLERVRIHFSPAKTGRIEWTLGDRRRGQFTAQRIAANDPQSSDEVWEITFRKPPTGDVALAAVRTSPAAETNFVSPASVADARTQTATVEITADSALPLRIVNRTLTPLPAAPTQGAQERTRGLFRYEPAQSFDGSTAPLSVVRSAVAPETLPNALVWNIRYETKYDANRRLSHRATMYVQSLAGGRCRIVPEEPATLSAVRVNGQAIADVGSDEAVVPLAGDSGLYRIEVDYQSEDRAAGRLRLVELPTLRVDAPVLFSSRDVALPAAFDVPADAGLKSVRIDRGGSWLRRLFGPLTPPKPKWSPSGRGNEKTPATLPVVARNGRAADEIAIVQQAIGAAARQAASSAAPLLWGEAWKAAAARLAAEGRGALRFDVVALRRAAVELRDVVDVSRSDAYDDRALGEQLLVSRGVVAAIDEAGLIFTTASGVSIGDDDALRVFDSPAVSQAIAIGDPPLTLEQWQAAPAGAWSQSEGAPSLFADEPSGQEYVVPLEGDSWGIWIVRREIPPLAAIAFVAVGLVAARRLYVRRRSLLPWLFAGCAAAAAALPEWLGVPAASGLLGLAGGVAFCLVLPPRAPRRSSGLGVTGVRTNDRSTGRSSTAQLVQGAILLLSAAVAVRSLSAADAGGAASSPALLVFIPIDADGKPSGDRFQVPERLLKDLRDRVAAGPVATSPTLVQRARYTAVVGRDIEQTRFVVTELQATFDLQVLQAPTKVTLPLGVGPAGGTLSTMLDGRDVEVAVGATGQTISFDVVDTGPVRLEVVLKPNLATAPQPAFSPTVPRVVDAELTILVPSEIAGLTVGQAAEALRWSESRREALVRLMPSDKLTISWSDATTAPAQSTSIDQLTWLRVRPGSVVLDLRLVVRPPAGGLKEILLSADPRLQWLPKRSQDSLVADVEQSPITSDQATVGQRVRVELTRPILKEEVVELSFLFTGATGVGNMRLPELRLADEFTGVRRFAYGVDPLLIAAPGSEVGLKPLAVPEFMKAWGAEPGLPQATYEVVAVPGWSLATRPKPPTVRAKQSQQVVCGKQQIQVAFEADVVVADGLIYHHELHAPAGLQVASIDVAEIGDNSGGRVGRWSRDAQNRITVFLRAPIGDRHRLTLRGTIPTPADGVVPLPEVTLLNAAYDERLVQVARTPEVLVTASDVARLTSLETDGVEPTATAARLVQSWRLDGDHPAATLKVVDNPRQVEAKLVSTYVPEGKSWRYELQLALNVTAGLLDEITLNLPSQIATPLAITPSMPYEVIPAGDAAPRRLRIRPRQALSGKYELRLNAALSEADRDESLPIVTLGRIAAVQHLLRLPRHAGLNPVRWETSQLAAVDDVKPGPAAPLGQEFETFRVVGADPQAVLRSVRGAGGRPYVRLAEHRLLPHSDGTLIGLSSFLVEPAGAELGVFRAGANVELLSIAVGGSVVSPEREADGRWRIPFASEQMPHTIDVLYRRNVAGDADDRIDLPSFENMKAERNLVIAFSDARGKRAEFVGTPAVDALRAGEERLAALDAVLNDLAIDGSGASAEWSVPLLRRRAEVVARLRLVSTAVPDSPAAKRVKDYLAAYDERARAPQPAVGTALDRTEAFDLPGLWRSAFADECDEAFTVAGSDLDQLRLRFTSREQGVDWRFLYVPLACILFVPACRWFAHIDGFMRWPQLAGAIAGVAWLLALRPTIVGWIILGVVVACRLHPSLRHVRERTLSLSPRPGALRRT